MESKNLLCLHTGGISKSFEELSLYQPPEATKTYSPVAHSDLISIVKQNAEKTLAGYSFKDESFGVSPKIGENIGDKLFGVMTYEHDTIPELGLTIGIRNSYDQSLSAGLVCGAKVFVCDNLAFSGDIRVSRKHTGDVLGDLENLITSAMYQAPSRHKAIAHDMDYMKEFTCTDDEAYSILGVAYGREILKPRQLLRAKHAWLKPPQEDFEDRNLWSLYNAMTEALKSSSAREIMESHVASHQLVMNEGIMLLEDDVYSKQDFGKLKVGEHLV
jgi:hypothetical protein